MTYLKLFKASYYNRNTLNQFWNKNTTEDIQQLINTWFLKIGASLKYLINKR